MGQRDMIVSVRFPEDVLRKLQLIGQVTEQGVGSIIRAAVSKHIEEVTNNTEFRNKATEMQRATNEMLDALLRPETR